jgi:WD40 repeat protein
MVNGQDSAGRVIGAAVWLMPPGRRDWGEAMRAELACLSAPAERRDFAFGCLRAVVASCVLTAVVKYVAFVSATIAFAVVSGMTGAIRTEIVLCGLLAPLVLWRVGRGDGGRGAVGASRVVRACRGAHLLLAALGLGAAAGFLASVVPPEGTPVVVAALALLMAVLAGHVAIGLVLTSAASRARTLTAALATGFGVACGVGWCVVMPFNRPLALPPGWRLGTALGVALIVVGLPALASVAAIRFSGEAGQGWLAGLGTASVAALVVLASGAATIWFLPWVIDWGLLDTGPQWRPPDLIEQVVPSYFRLLVVAPAVGALVGWLVSLTFDHPALAHQTRWTAATRRAGAVLAVAVVALGLSQYASTVDSDTTQFGAVGTTNVAFSPAGHTLVTANGNDTWILWDIDEPGAPARLATFNDQVLYSPDGLTLASRNVLWSLSSRGAPHRLTTFTGGEPLAFSPDGRTLLTHDRHTALLWDVTNRHHPVPLSTFDAGEEALFTAPGNILITRGNTANTATLRDVTDPHYPEPLATIPAPAQIVPSPDGTLLGLAALGGPVDIWNIADPRHPARTRLADTRNEKVQFSANHLIATANNRGTVRLWNTDGTLIATLPPPPGRIPDQIGISSTLPSLAFSTDGHTLSTVFGNRLASRWDVANPAHPLRLNTISRTTQGAGVVVFSPDQTIVAGAAVDGSNSVTLWHVTPTTPMLRPDQATASSALIGGV